MASQLLNHKIRQVPVNAFRLKSGYRILHIYFFFARGLSKVRTLGALCLEGCGLVRLHQVLGVPDGLVSLHQVLGVPGGLGALVVSFGLVAAVAQS